MGREVSILNIYKFLVSHRMPKITSMGIQDESRILLVLGDDGDVVVNPRASLHQSTSIDERKKRKFVIS